MRGSIAQIIIYLASGSLIGLVSWGNGIEFTILSSLIFLAYLLIPKRLNLLFFMLGYYLLGSKGLLIGSISYYNHISSGLISWFAQAFVVSIMWVIIWSPSQKRRYYLFVLVLLIHILPPVGFVSLLNPLPSAGLIFPNFGFFGMLLLLMSIYLLAFFITKIKKDKYTAINLSVSFFILLIVLFQISNAKVKYDTDIKSVETAFKYNPEEVDILKDYIRVSKYFNIANNAKENSILLPENALGFYMQSQKVVWDDLKKSKRVYAGAYITNDENLSYSNVLLSIDSNSTKTLYRQRVPILIAMWQPFTSQGASATIYEDPVVPIDGKNTGVFICYEQFVTYLYMQTMFFKPQRLFGISNIYWAKNTNIENMQKEIMGLYGLLFDIPIAYSVNR